MKCVLICSTVFKCIYKLYILCNNTCQSSTNQIYHWRFCSIFLWFVKSLDNMYEVCLSDVITIMYGIYLLFFVCVFSKIKFVIKSTLSCICASLSSTMSHWTLFQHLLYNCSICSRLLIRDHRCVETRLFRVSLKTNMQQNAGWMLFLRISDA